MRIYGYFLGLVLFQGFSSKAFAFENDKELSQNIVGTWSYIFNEWNYGFIEFQDSGDKCEVNFEFNSQGQTSLYLYWNKWKIENNVIKTTMHATNTNIPVGQIIDDKIDLLTESKLNVYMVNPQKMKTVFHSRLQNGKESKICHMVKFHLKSKKIKFN